mgnify:CR=1 FL=1
MAIKKLERDGMVAVVYSPGYGAGWASWDRKYAEFLCMDAGIAEAVERGDYQEAIRLATEKDKDIYTGGGWGLKIKWVPKGEAFEIDEYDGSESVRIIGEIDAMIA